MKQATLQNLFLHQLRDVYDAERQLVKVLPKLAKAAGSEELADALSSHLEETQEHVSRIERVFEFVGAAAKAKPCAAMKGLVAEGSEALQEMDKGAERDLMIIAAGQRVEHYEMAAYGTLIAIAQQLSLDGAVELLQKTGGEEAAADNKLGEIATSIYETEDEDDDVRGESEAAMAHAGNSTRGGKSLK
jgi:ferritin-like metal-binding protein YciE